MTTKPNSFLAFLSTIAIFFGAGGALCAYGAYLYLAPGPLMEEKLVLIERGAGVGKIAVTLEKEGVIAAPFLFKAGARLSGRGGSLKAGEYLFPAGISARDSLALLHEGKVFGRAVTIPEGLTSFQIVKTLNATEGLDGDITDIPPEGSLLPETYSFISGDTRQGKIERMQDAMRETIRELWPKRAQDLPFETVEEAITLASIVEKETGVSSERARIAGVFINRLRKGIPLQTDPTVIYALTKGQVKDDGRGPLGRRLLLKDLEVDDPYNTYKYAGLPPGPIANPGRAAIEAVLNPEQNDYLYFVADGSGGHVFSSTLAEHNRNVAKWRKIRREQN